MHNANIIKWFELLVHHLEHILDTKQGKDRLIYTYKRNSIKKALAVIRTIDHPITRATELAHIKSIGSGTCRRIDEIIATGRLAEVDLAQIKPNQIDYVNELVSVFGIGRTTALKLYREHGIDSIDALRRAVKQSTIQLPPNISKGLRYIDQLIRSIPRAKIDKIYSYLIYQGIGLDGEMDTRLCGSYRREALVSGDIDVMISHPLVRTKKQADGSDLLARYVGRLVADGFIVESLTRPDTPTKYMGICRVGKKMARIDIRYIAQESYYTALLYFTGSARFNEQMRGVAKSMGYGLNEYALTDSHGKPFTIHSEDDVFTRLSMEYVMPVDR
jgi:DNA polymerase beta